MADLKRSIKQGVRAGLGTTLTAVHRLGLTRANLLRHQGLTARRLEIGPGPRRIEGFETLNTVGWLNVDYVWDATRPLPFDDGTFEIVYASHILEHVSWRGIPETLREWVRILAPGGRLEIWVPDGYKLAKLLVDLDDGVPRDEWQDGWKDAEVRGDPWRWANGRILYGLRDDYPSWHQAIITPAALARWMAEAGLEGVAPLRSPDEVRGHDHGWINLGMVGTKPA